MAIFLGFIIPWGPLLKCILSCRHHIFSDHVANDVWMTLETSLFRINSKSHIWLSRGIPEQFTSFYPRLMWRTKHGTLCCMRCVSGTPKYWVVLCCNWCRATRHDVIDCMCDVENLWTSLFLLVRSGTT
jgi:hypothetical protein